MMRDTSLYAYFEAKKQLGNKQQLVLETIRAHPGIHDRAIAEILGWPINCVTGRRHELEAAGLIVDAGKVADDQTGRYVHIWREMI